MSKKHDVEEALLVADGVLMTMMALWPEAESNEKYFKIRNKALDSSQFVTGWTWDEIDEVIKSWVHGEES